MFWRAYLNVDLPKEHFNMEDSHSTSHNYVESRFNDIFWWAMEYESVKNLALRKFGRRLFYLDNDLKSRLMQYCPVGFLCIACNLQLDVGGETAKKNMCDLNGRFKPYYSYF